MRRYVGEISRGTPFRMSQWATPKSRAVVAQDVAVVPELLDDARCVHLHLEFGFLYYFVRFLSNKSTAIFPIYLIHAFFKS